MIIILWKSHTIATPCVCRDLCPFSQKSISEHRCWMRRCGAQLSSPFIPKVLNRVEVRVLCRPLKFFHKSLLIMSLCTPLMHRNIVMLEHLGSLVPVKENQYLMLQYKRQLYSSSVVATVKGMPTYGCNGQVSKYFCHIVHLWVP